MSNFIKVLACTKETSIFFFWSWLSFNFTLSYEAGFDKPTVLKFHPPLCRITAYATMPGYFFLNFSFHAFDSNSWYIINGLYSGPGFELTTSWTLIFTLTTSPWRLARVLYLYKVKTLQNQIMLCYYKFF